MAETNQTQAVESNYSTVPNIQDNGKISICMIKNWNTCKDDKRPFPHTVTAELIAGDCSTNAPLVRFNRSNKGLTSQQSQFCDAIGVSDNLTGIEGYKEGIAAAEKAYKTLFVVVIGRLNEMKDQEGTPRMEYEVVEFNDSTVFAHCPSSIMDAANTEMNNRVNAMEKGSTASNNFKALLAKKKAVAPKTLPLTDNRTKWDDTEYTETTEVVEGRTVYIHNATGERVVNVNGFAKVLA